MKYPLLVPVIGHGITDVVDLPKTTLLYNFYSAIIVGNLNVNQRKIVLTGASIFHIAQDIPYNNYKYLCSALFHCLWLKKPIVAKLYLLLFHTPLHYFRIYLMDENWGLKFFLGILMSTMAALLLPLNVDEYLDRKFEKIWWLSPILAHIFLTEKIKQNYIINNFSSG